jgi:4-amino-4-deoxy-L-arabinose transferase-like glycosyltransferase
METRARRFPVASDVALAAVLAIGLALRVATILGRRGDILFDYPVVDEERYVALGRALAEGRGGDPGAWYHPPGLTYALAACFRMFGPALLAPRLVQALVSTASGGLTFLVARRLFTPPIALAASAVVSLHGVLVFECYELLPPTWMLAADLLALWLLLRAREEGTPGAAVVAGAGLGLAAVFGPTVLPFVAFAAAWLRKPALAGALVLGVLLPIAPVAWGNWQRGHEVVLVSTNGGVNFYLGNNEHPEQTLAIRPGEHWAALDDEPIRQGAVSPAARSSWFLRRGLDFWRAHPGQALGQTLRKVYLFFDGPEIPRDTDLYAMRSDSIVLRLLVTPGPPWVPDGVLVPLSLIGAFLAWPERRKLAPAYAFVALQVLVVAAFFVTSRYRVPSLPVLSMFACAGVARVASGSRNLRAGAAVTFVALALVLNVATHESSVSYAAEQDFYRGLALQRSLHRPAPAIEAFRRASAEDPADGRIWFELGNALDAAGRPDEAIDAWSRAGEADPWDPRGRRRASVARARRGDLAGAIEALQANVDSRTHPDAFYATDHLNLALLCAKSGRDARALSELAAARNADPAWFQRTAAAFARSVQSAPDVSPAFQEAVAAASSSP